MNGDRPGKPTTGNMWHLAGMGMELAAAVGGGCALGYVIDRHFGTGHWGLIIGALVGIVGGLYNMIRKAVHESLEMSRKRPPKRNSTGRDGKKPGDPPEVKSG